MDRLRNWPNFKVWFLQRKAMLLQELFWPAGEKRKKNWSMTISKKSYLTKVRCLTKRYLCWLHLPLGPSSLGSVTKTNKPALGRVGRIRVEKQWKLNWNYLNYLRIKVNDQNETLLVLFAFMKFFGKYFTRMFFILSMASDKEVSVTQQRLLGTADQPISQLPPNPDVCECRPQHRVLRPLLFDQWVGSFTSPYQFHVWRWRRQGQQLKRHRPMMRSSELRQM